MKKSRGLPIEGVLKMFSLIGLLLLMALPVAADESLEITARRLEEELISPCCWRQPVSVHESAAAVQIRREIREMLDQGMTPDRILEFYVSRYGERILSSPPASGFNFLAYLLPVVALALGALVVFAFFRRHRFVPPGRQRRRAGTIPPRYAELLDKELREG